MVRSWPLRGAFGALLVALFALSCDTATGPAPLSNSPESSDLLDIRLPKVLPDLGRKDDDVPPDEGAKTPGETPGELVFITEVGAQGGPLSVSSVLGLLGGVLELNGYGIDVPRGAVMQLTLFRLTTPSSPVIDVELDALPLNPVGRLTPRFLHFHTPVTVSLPYSRATNVTDEDRLVIVRLLPNGRYEIMPSVVDKQNKVVSAELDHFSKYAMASN